MYKSMTPDEYIAVRIDDQCAYYDKSAVRNKARHFLTRRTAVIGAAAVPILANVPFDALGVYHTVPTTLVSLLVTIVVGLETVNRHGDLWKNFRSTYEFLRSKKFHFLTGEGVYRNLDSDAAFLLLVERCENRIATENSASLSIIETAAQRGDVSAVPHSIDATSSGDRA
jgi:hypothetical protein